MLILLSCNQSFLKGAFHQFYTFRSVYTAQVLCSLRKVAGALHGAFEIFGKITLDDHGYLGFGVNTMDMMDMIHISQKLML